MNHYGTAVPLDHSLCRHARARRPHPLAVVAVAAVAVCSVTGFADRPTSSAATDLAVLAASADAYRPAVRLRRSGGLRFPVGAMPDGSPSRCAVLNNFGDPRSLGRTHEGVDIMAKLGQEVFAVANGVLVRLDPIDAPRSGLAWALVADDGTYYYYAHLSATAPGLVVGTRVGNGQVIGYVGDTGNAGPGNSHLHFEVHPGGQGRPAVDPFPLLDIPITCSV